MQHVDRFGELRDIEETERPVAVAYANLHDAGADRRHRLPVARLATALHLTQVETELPPSLLRQCTEICSGSAPRSARTDPTQIMSLSVTNENTNVCILLQGCIWSAARIPQVV